MLIIFLTAIGVGGATMVGALIGFGVKHIPDSVQDSVLGLATGIMLYATMFGLLLPAMENTGPWTALLMTAGLLMGCLIMTLSKKLIPTLRKVTGIQKATKETDRILLFVFAIALHNLPEGIAAGVGFGTDNTTTALMIAGGIALQNLPEGMVIISPLLSAGLSQKRTLCIALTTGASEIFGTFFGYYTVSFSTAALPFILSLAGGTMLYVICGEMIPEIYGKGHEKRAIYSIILGFCGMLLIDVGI